MRHRFISSKMKKEIPLMNDEKIAQHIPKTKWFNGTNLHNMLKQFPILYIKPDNGTAGIGIIQVKTLNSSESLISFKETNKRCSTKNLFFEIRKRMNPNESYIIQQGIKLATYQNRPFDLRVVLQKPYNQWKLTWMSARVAPKSTSIVTNVARGAVDAKIIDTIKGADQRFNVSKVVRQLTYVSYRIAQKLGSHFPFRIVGLDMGIDRNGKTWFIEANTDPNFHGLQKLDRKQYKRYRQAQKIIDARR